MISSLISLPKPFCLADTCSADFPHIRQFFENEGELLRQRLRKQNIAQYDYNTNVTEENRLRMIATSTQNAAENVKVAQTIQKQRYDQIEDPCLKRLAKYSSEIGADILNSKDYEALQNAISNMQTNYASAKVCSYKDPGDCSLSLEPHIQERLSNSRDPEELAHYWKQWYDTAGTPMRENFRKYIELSNKAAKLNGK